MVLFFEWFWIGDCFWEWLWIGEWLWVRDWFWFRLGFVLMNDCRFVSKIPFSIVLSNEHNSYINNKFYPQNLLSIENQIKLSIVKTYIFIKSTLTLNQFFSLLSSNQTLLIKSFFLSSMWAWLSWDPQVNSTTKVQADKMIENLKSLKRLWKETSL